jgi:predicted nucleic acid-binding protein
VSYLLDTCIISDISRSADAGLLRWAKAQNPLDLHLSVLTLGEIQTGIALLPGRDPRRGPLQSWLEDQLPGQFAGRLVPIGPTTALAYGRLAAAGRREGRPLPAIDGLLLATAQAHGLTLVTRNVSDIEGRGVPVLNPYSGVRPDS